MHSVTWSEMASLGCAGKHHKSKGSPPPVRVSSSSTPSYPVFQISWFQRGPTAAIPVIQLHVCCVFCEGVQGSLWLTSGPWLCFRRLDCSIAELQIDKMLVFLIFLKSTSFPDSCVQWHWTNPRSQSPFNGLPSWPVSFPIVVQSLSHLFATSGTIAWQTPLSRQEY